MRLDLLFASKNRNEITLPVIMLIMVVYTILMAWAKLRPPLRLRLNNAWK